MPFTSSLFRSQKVLIMMFFLLLIFFLILLLRLFFIRLSISSCHGNSSNCREVIFSFFSRSRKKKQEHEREGKEQRTRQRTRLVYRTEPMKGRTVQIVLCLVWYKI